jgi:hypothetical protein
MSAVIMRRRISITRNRRFIAYDDIIIKRLAQVGKPRSAAATEAVLV